MHFEAWSFIVNAAARLHDTRGNEHLSELRVLEFGAHDVNGSPRQLFAGCAEYVGVDPWPGRGVDWMGKAQDYDGQERFDVVITAEAMEHDPDAQGQISSAWRALKPGGTLILTAAAEPRLPHRCDGYQGDLAGEYYANISPDELRGWLANWSDVVVTHDKHHGHVYAVAVKPCN